MALRTILLTFILVSCSLKGTALATDVEQSVTRSGLTVFPTKVAFLPARRTATFEVENKSDKPTLISAKVFQWTQQSGLDKHLASRDVIVNPPVARLPAGSKQVFRVGLRRAPDRVKELTYRIHVKEVPLPEQGPAVGPKMLVGFYLPVFISPLSFDNYAAEVQWKIKERLTNGDVVIEAQNLGGKHLRTKGVALTDGSRVLAKQTGVHYVLPYSTRRYYADFHANKASKPKALIVMHDNKPSQVIALD